MSDDGVCCGDGEEAQQKMLKKLVGKISLTGKEASLF